MRLFPVVKWLTILFAFISLIALVIGTILFDRYWNELPDTGILRNVQYQLPLSVYSKSGELIAQFGEKKRSPVNIPDIPQPLVNAFIAAEDDRFFEHPGVDYQGLFRAGIQLLLTGKKKQGGSTITMQVVRNFLLTRDKTYKRKIIEIFLAIKIERELSKEDILELYLNKIFLGHRAYGVAAAANVYFGKELDQLTLAETAMIAGLPKAPSTYNPITNPKRALKRRQYVLERMRALNFISQSEFDLASIQPVTAKLGTQHDDFVAAPFVAEMVRDDLFNQFGDEIYNSGMKVYTTIDTQLQLDANTALTGALHEYDQRHGYRKPARTANQIPKDLATYKNTGDTEPAWVKKVDKKQISAELKNGSTIDLPWENIKWARIYKNRNALGPPLKSARDIVNPGDIIRVRTLQNGTWALTQVPQVEGAIIALNPKNGAILALSGGYDFRNNKFNRATQSRRQPGSGFKPIIYTTALEHGFTTASIINDAPVVVDDSSQESAWRPENYSRKFFGPTRLRTALRKSRNLVSIRLVRQIGIDQVLNTAKRFGFHGDQLPNSLSLALGSGQASPLQMARVFSVFANGGFLINPYLIDRIESNSGEILFQSDPASVCPLCSEQELEASTASYAPRIISPQVNFLMNSMLRDVVQRGTATRAKKLGRKDLAGKTGTTNDQRDAWFNGFTSDIVVTTWVGFDDSSPLGGKETGGRAALPMWINFMENALKLQPVETPLQAPDGIVKVYIDPSTGLLIASDKNKGIWEFFREENRPSQQIHQPQDVNHGEVDEAVETLF